MVATSRMKKAPSRGKSRPLTRAEKRSTQKALKKVRTNKVGSFDSSLSSKAEKLLSGVTTQKVAVEYLSPSYLESEVAKVLESKKFRGRYIVEAPMGTRPLQGDPKVQINRNASGPYSCSSCGTQIPSGGPYARAAYTSTRRVEIRERGCPKCQDAMLTCAAETGKMPMPSDLMKELKRLSVHTDHPRWENLIQELNGRYVGNAVDVRVFDYEMEAALKAKLLNETTEHLAEG